MVSPAVEILDQTIRENARRSERAQGDSGMLSLLGRTVDEWKVHVDGLDNHWLDCQIGYGVAASMQGAILFGTDASPTPPQQRLRLSEIPHLARSWLSSRSGGGISGRAGNHSMTGQATP